MDEDLAFLGIIGGEIVVEVAGTDRLNYRMVFRCPRKLTDAELKELREFAEGQILDGAGSCGLDVEVDGEEAYIQCEIPDGTDRMTTIEQIDDGVPVPDLNPVAICASRGDLEGVIKALAAGEPIEGRVQGVTPLAIAISCENKSIVTELLRQGANPNGLGDSNFSPLLICATNVEEDLAIEIAELLLAHGADPHYQTPDTEYTALFMAENREKPKLMALLKEAMKK